MPYKQRCVRNKKLFNAATRCLKASVKRVLFALMYLHLLVEVMRFYLAQATLKEEKPRNVMFYIAFLADNIITWNGTQSNCSVLSPKAIWRL